MLPAVTIPPPAARSGLVAIPLDLSGIDRPVDRIGVEHLAIFRGRRRLSLAGASVEVGADGTATLLVPRGVTAPRSTYRVLVGWGEALESAGVPMRDVATLVWQSPKPSPQLVAAIRDVLARGRSALAAVQVRRT